MEGQDSSSCCLPDDPHLLEGGQRGQDGATHPHRVLVLRRCDDLDLHRVGRQGGDLLHLVTNAPGDTVVPPASPVLT